MKKSHDTWYDTAKWHRVREAVLRRDSYTDQVQKRYSLMPSEATLVHHIFPREVFPEWQYEAWNLVSVSNKTHQKLHNRNDDRLTQEGYDLLQRTARRNGIDLNPLENRLKLVKP